MVRPATFRLIAAPRGTCLVTRTRDAWGRVDGHGEAAVVAVAAELSVTVTVTALNVWAALVTVPASLPPALIRKLAGRCSAHSCRVCSGSWSPIALIPPHRRSRLIAW